MRCSVLFTCPVVLFALACSSAPPPQPACPEVRPPPPPAIEAPRRAALPPITFADAVKDAAVAEPSEISTRLVPIVAHNRDLVWKGEGAARRVLLVTWTSWNGYDDKAGQSIPLTREVWATVAPAVQKFCKALPPDEAARTLRLEQLLGLPAKNGKDRFVELWADPEDLFRPCADPEITDRECSVDFPRSGRFVTVSADHVKWFQELSKKSYGPDGYPWTRLGYTYDWGNPESREGLSELVIRPGASVEVRAVAKNADYCK